jgi:hypothetical protein
MKNLPTSPASLLVGRTATRRLLNQTKFRLRLPRQEELDLCCAVNWPPVAFENDKPCLLAVWAINFSFWTS